MKLINSEKGVALMIVLILSIVASIYLSSYTIWVIWDQRNLGVQQKVDLAGELALSGLNRALVNLYQDTNWLDGNINGQNVTLPNSASPNNFYVLYNSSPLSTGNYTVSIRYLYNNATNIFFSDRLWVRSIGRTTEASRTLQQIVNADIVNNMNTNLTYWALQPAMNEALTNHNLGIAGFQWTEYPASPSGKNLNIKGGYSPDFSYRHCSDFFPILQGSFTVVSGANVTLSGLTIQ